MRRRQMKKQKQIIIISSLCLLLCLCVGYAAFSTQLSIRAKGNIKELPGTEMGGIKVNTVTDGDGLYEDIYEEGRYVYRGTDPDNYIEFNGELWRIIAKEADGAYKVVRNEVLPEEMPFDEEDYRDSGSGGAGGTYCANSSYGCNSWVSTANIVGMPEHFTNGDVTGTVLKDSSLKEYLNGEYLTSIQAKTPSDYSKVISYTWNIGGVVYNNESLSEQITGEKAYQWNGKVGLITHSDYIRANSNQELCGNAKINYDNCQQCRNLDWMYIPGTVWWTLSPRADGCNNVWVVRDDGSLRGGSAYSSRGVRPALYLSSDITLTGKGTKAEPYVIS